MTITLEESPPLLEVEGDVARIILNRPQRRNRLEAGDLRVLLTHFDTLERDRNIRFVVLTGRTVPQRAVFSAGYNMSEHGAELPGAHLSDVMNRLAGLRPLTICALSGSLYGGACDFPMSTDFAIGVDGMEMRVSAAAIGLHYYPAGIVRCVQRFGALRAKQMFVAARTFKDVELLSMGYVERLVPPEQLEAAVAELVEGMRPLAPANQQHLKKSINEVVSGAYDANVLLQRMEDSMRSADFLEGVAAFGERREPRFQSPTW